METLVLLTIGAFGICVGFLVGRYVWPAAAAADPAMLLAAQTEAACLSQECATLRSRTETLEAERQTVANNASALAEESARLTERTTQLTEQLSGRDFRMRELDAQRAAAVDERGQLAAEVARLQERENALAAKTEEQVIRIASGDDRARALEAQRDVVAAEAKALTAELTGLREREVALNTKIEEQAAQFAEMRQKLPAEFENIANRILKTASNELSEDSRKTLTTLLDPLRDRIQEFQGKVESTFDAEKREVLSLKEQIRQMVETSHTIGRQADGLAKALRSDAQRLGSWGELALERILESAGLTEGREYVSQGRGLGLKSEEGGIQRPDIIVKLPEGRAVIVDSKVPLTTYERLIAAKEQADHEACRSQFVRDVKGHIEGLSGKRYQDNGKLQAHDYVLMFVPIEGALAAALQAEPDLFSYGWDRRVILVGPPTLLMTMQTVASIWRYEAQGQNAQEIARLAGDLCDKISSSLTDLQAAADKMSGALSSHNEAVKRLATGKGNVLTIGERIRSLGVKTRRPGPAVLVDGVAFGAGSDAIEVSVMPSVESPEPQPLVNGD